VAGLAERVYPWVPAWAQDALVTAYGVKLLLIRRGLTYWRMRAHYRDSLRWTRDELERHQLVRLRDFLRSVRAESPYYRDLLSERDVDVRSVDELGRLPVLTKDTLRTEGHRIRTIRRGVEVHTGGTTGTPLAVLFRRGDIEERMAALDAWRETHGVGSWSRRATFSGRIVVPLDLKPGEAVARTNLVLRQRLYSTFHLSPPHLDTYVADLERFRPTFVDGFPSAVASVAAHVRATTGHLQWRPRVVFTTSENLYDAQRRLIHDAFRCEARTQYASAEGAPFVTECTHGRLHYDLRTGVIEQGDGSILVTSFTTLGTPLVRYRIGDQMDMSPGTCTCGNQNPVIQSIVGREQEYIVSPTRGVVAVGLIDIFKRIPPVVRQAQVVQEREGELTLRLVRDGERFSAEHEATLRSALSERVGGEMAVRLEYADWIAPEANGKTPYIKRNPAIDVRTGPSR
jgi:phenylacetate-CoA ligase